MVDFLKAQWMSHLDESLVKSFYEEQTKEEQEAGFEDVLTFGTAGIRSTFGLGPGRLNKFTIRKVALGLAQYLKQKNEHPTVVIHFDTRFLSHEFSQEIARVLATEGVSVVLADTYKSTPELSFAVRELKATAGVMITASHNPSHYNGIKIYGSDGGQLLPKASEDLSQYINAIESPLEIEAQDFNSLKKEKLITSLPTEVTEAYKQGVKDLVGTIEENSARVVLTSLHGTSLPIAADILTELGFDNYVIETTQSKPDGRFPTVKSANPEEEAAFEFGKRLAEQENASLIIATDPDADRFGFVERYEDGSTRYFNGNEIGLILLKLRYQQLQTSGNAFYMVKSIVTGALSEVLASALDIKVVNVLTGFKYISEELELRQQQNDDAQLVLAFEESHGYLAKDLSRDKDAIQFIPLLVKYKQLLYQNGLTFKAVLEDIYKEIGRYKDLTLSPSFEGPKGRQKIEAMMTHFRNDTSEHIVGLKVKTKEDYLTQKTTHLPTGEETAIMLPQADLIRYTFDEGFIALRPSGTEPKIKIYFSLNVPDFKALVNNFKALYLAES
ncbi:phospho-sugar mutase [Staphylococcus coagulans]|uniref:phospho-sugar mutase n=1 Tax=Staphylococcus coagulans TaxID=74706 RepID=UPI00067A27C8|nr:phospho-sugar mutase [Staphylococcus coagulans]AKS67489.1 phosphoglucomutase [Staphylococcus schleiferi]MBA8773864.1 phosphoglucomutase [Staphylococcus coagulans]UNB45530.1 phospho-sugar mutase [Staphylococcus coagulans]